MWEKSTLRCAARFQRSCKRTCSKMKTKSSLLEAPLQQANLAMSYHCRILKAKEKKKTITFFEKINIRETIEPKKSLQKIDNDSNSNVVMSLWCFHQFDFTEWEILVNKHKNPFQRDTLRSFQMLCYGTMCIFEPF